ncbi:hypothetical protein [Ruminiclostridium papyrosolvens]|uniref:Uncharacterized protein n=1 Tax=Ruminiclostridium papyrosolvens C7 TaxID=1330534 RepID=U4R600_9FIRM|nr:hypothetical protein [Ruminiclostridium papyrosolvens]EPR13465.1 hypothetical protein L323_04455 [Ruminiclostridium papyrosolvens C7]
MNNIFTQNEKLFYIDIKDGLICEGKFIESNGNGIWIRLKGDSLNTYVYSDLVEERVFKDYGSAAEGLETIKNNMKARLSKDDMFIKDLLTRLKKSEGDLYANIIVEILCEKTNISLN